MYLIGFCFIFKVHVDRWIEWICMRKWFLDKPVPCTLFTRELQEARDSLCSSVMPVWNYSEPELYFQMWSTRPIAG